MINFNNLEIVRARMHKVHSKFSINRDTAEVEYLEDAFTLDEGIKGIIRDRLLQSFGTQGKSFELSIEDESEDSCFSQIKDLNQISDNDFYETSKVIAEKLASCQGVKRIPSGYILLLECLKTDGMPLYVIIKAETHSAINVGGNHTEALQQLILSPAQKLYKSAIFEQISLAEGTLTKQNFKVYLFDSQFNEGSKLASYFFKDFLGFSISTNSSLLTKQFYQLFNAEIDKQFKQDAEHASMYKDGLIACLNNQHSIINPHDVVCDIIPVDKRDSFISNVVENSPSSFTKNTELLNRVLTHKSIFLTDKVKLFAPTDMFDNVISIESDPEDSNIKLVKVRINP